MKRRVVWSEAARAEYLAALRYIAERNPDAAARVAGRIEETGASLADPTGDEAVAILHVIHGARDWPEGQWPRG